eukprot:3599938-Heterocapsa_arctica.AAC.1
MHSFDARRESLQALIKDVGSHVSDCRGCWDLRHCSRRSSQSSQGFEVVPFSGVFGIGGATTLKTDRGFQTPRQWLGS